MALRNTKIARDIVQTCNKLIPAKYEVAAISTKKPSENAEEKTDQERYRYILSHTTKPSELPKLIVQNDLARSNIQHLQPALQQKYLEVDAKAHNEYARDFINREVDCPFPNPIKHHQSPTMKGENTKTLDLSRHFKKTKLIVNRNYSTSPFLLVSRSFSNKKKKSDHEKCDPKKKICRKNQTCPNFVIDNCPERKVTECFHHYQDPKCTKKYAPYPSYSEKCVENLPEDPSECMQCPWQKCGGVDSIKPPKRGYHTSTKHYNMAMIPTKQGLNVPIFPFYKRCDASKEPCKEPPGICEKLKKKQKDKCPEKKKEKKKKCKLDSNWTTAYALWNSKNVIPDELESLQCDSEGCAKFPFDKRQADYNHVSKRKCVVKKNPKCNRRKKVRVPSCDSGDCKRSCIDATQTTAYDLKKCPENSDECPKSERKCPKVDLTINEKYRPKDPCCEDHKKNKMIVRKHRRRRPKVYVPKSNRCL